MHWVNVYVVLPRVRTLAGLYLIKPLDLERSINLLQCPPESHSLRATIRIAKKVHSSPCWVTTLPIKINRIIYMYTKFCHHVSAMFFTYVLRHSTAYAIKQYTCKTVQLQLNFLALAIYLDFTTIWTRGLDFIVRLDRYSSSVFCIEGANLI